jgi:hypothetical protein
VHIDEREFGMGDNVLRHYQCRLRFVLLKIHVLRRLSACIDTIQQQQKKYIKMLHKI